MVFPMQVVFFDAFGTDFQWIREPTYTATLVP